jgi:hypothetical protein
MTSDTPIAFGLHPKTFCREFKINITLSPFLPGPPPGMGRSSHPVEVMGRSSHNPDVSSGKIVVVPIGNKLVARLNLGLMARKQARQILILVESYEG